MMSDKGRSVAILELAFEVFRGCCWSHRIVRSGEVRRHIRCVCCYQVMRALLRVCEENFEQVKADGIVVRMNENVGSLP